jgi:putative transposase
VLELLKETKTISQIAAEYEVHPNVLRAWRDQAVKELPAVFEKRDSLIDAQAAQAKQLEELYAEIGRLTTHVTFLKKRWLSSIALTNCIPPILIYGSRKLTMLLQPDFGPINRKRVQRYMREMGIAGIAPGPNLSKRATQHRIYPYLLRGVTAQAPDHIWGSDGAYVYAAVQDPVGAYLALMPG